MDQWHIIAERIGCDQGNRCGCRRATRSEIENCPTVLLDMDGTDFPTGEYWCPSCELDTQA